MCHIYVGILAIRKMGFLMLIFIQNLYRKGSLRKSYYSFWSKRKKRKKDIYWERMAKQCKGTERRAKDNLNSYAIHG